MTYLMSRNYNPFVVFFQLVDINDGYLSLMDDNGETRDDIKNPENDLGKEIHNKFESDESFLVSLYVSFTFSPHKLKVH